MTPVLAQAKLNLSDALEMVAANGYKVVRVTAPVNTPAQQELTDEEIAAGLDFTPMQTDTPSQQELTDEELVNRAFDDKEQPPEQGDELTPEQEEELMGAPEPIMQDPLGLRATPEN